MSLITGVGGEVIILTKADRGDNLYYIDNLEIEAEAVPDDGWEFVEWGTSFGGGGVTENPTTQHVVPASGQIMAVFQETEPETYSIEIDLTQARNTSRIFINGEEYFLNHPDNDYKYEEGTTVEIRATSAPSTHGIYYIFRHWEGSIYSEENPVTLLMDSDVAIYPEFGAYVEVRPRTRSVDMEHGVGGEVIVHTAPAIADADLYELGQEIEVEAIPDPGWEFVEWNLSFSGSDNPSIQSAGNTPGEAVFRKIEDDPVAEN